MNWADILKSKKGPKLVQDYRYGRCQTNDGTRCVRNLQSPEKREFAGSKPDGKICMYCEDDTSEYADVPKSIWSSAKWKESDKSGKKKMLDAYVKRNSRYDMSKFQR